MASGNFTNPTYLYTLNTTTMKFKGFDDAPQDGKKVFTDASVVGCVVQIKYNLNGTTYISPVHSAYLHDVDNKTGRQLARQLSEQDYIDHLIEHIRRHIDVLEVDFSRYLNCMSIDPRE